MEIKEEIKETDRKLVTDMIKEGYNKTIYNIDHEEFLLNEKEGKVKKVQDDFMEIFKIFLKEKDEQKF